MCLAERWLGFNLTSRIINASWGSMRLHLLFEPMLLSLNMPLGSPNGGIDINHQKVI